MIEKEIQFRKKRELGEIISDSFEFIKQEYKPLSKLILTYVIPFLVLYAIVQINVQQKIVGTIDLTDQESIMKNIGPFYLNVFLFSLFGVFVHALLIGVLYSYIEIYIKKGKGEFNLPEIKLNLFANGQLAIGSSILLYLIVIFGFFLFIVPGIYFAITFSLVVASIIFEKHGLNNAFARSWNLVKAQWWQTFSLILLGIVITWVAGFILSIPSLLINSTTGAVEAIGAGAVAVAPTPLHWVLMGVTTVVSSLFWVVPYTFLAFQYFNLIERTKPTIQLEKDEFVQ